MVERRGTQPETDLGILSAQFDTLMEGAPLGVGLFDLEIRHVRVNAELERMNGRPADELLGRTPAELNGAVGEEAEVLYRSVMDSGKPMRDVLLTGEVSARPGETKHWSTSFYPVRDEADDIIGLCVIVADVTEQHSLYQALERSEARYRDLALDLQRSLRPGAPQALEGLGVAAVYLPGSDAATVGGDFYDVISLSPTSCLAVIGDVQGKGPAAASLTAALRFAIRTATVIERSPARVLRIVNEVLLRERSEDAYCTVACVLVDKDDVEARVHVASAGHPLPLVLRAADHRTEAVGEPGPLLGAVVDIEVPELVAELAPGDALVLYTDGVTEARRPGPGVDDEFFGEQGLHEALRSRPGGADAAAIAAEIEAAVSAFASGERDDLALVVLVNAHQ